MEMTAEQKLSLAWAKASVIKILPPMIRYISKTQFKEIMQIIDDEAKDLQVFFHSYDHLIKKDPNTYDVDASFIWGDRLDIQASLLSENHPCQTKVSTKVSKITEAYKLKDLLTHEHPDLTARNFVRLYRFINFSQLCKHLDNIERKGLHITEDIDDSLALGREI
jgi:hypothetical protein